jgi:transglutaminase-like putative cysteine protease
MTLPSLPPSPASPRRRLRGAGRAAAFVLAAAVIPAGTVAGSPAVANADAPRWTAATPDEMVERLFARARAGGEDALAALVVAASLDDRASFGKVRDGLETFAGSGGPLADEARWLRLRLLPSPPAAAWTGMRGVSYDAPPDPDGLVKAYAILGPFQDTGGGLMRREGPEAPGQSWSDTTARYSWGVYDVAWRRALPASATARGVPLDLYVFPRTESCTILASKVTVPAGGKPMLLHVGTTGAARVIWDGASVVASEEARPHLWLDRFTVRMVPAAGEHLVAVKVCSAAIADDGRVRLRFTDEQQRPLALQTSSDLRSMTVSPARVIAHDEPIAAAKPRGPKAPPPARMAAADDDPYADVPAPKKPVAMKPIAAKPVAAKGAPKAGKKDLATKGKPAHEEPGDEEQAVAIAPPPGMTLIPTALDRALAVGDAPGTAQALSAAILRLVGGADDVRSPRAPGLLDRVARAPDITPDQLAMAGWISPFGANRSGWLNLARTRAAAAHDDATAAFAQRRLVAAHIASRYVDWAVSTAAEEPLAGASDPEAVLIKALVQKQIGGAGFGRSALSALVALEGAQKERTPLAAMVELEGLSRTQPDLHLRVARRLAAIRADGRDHDYVEASRVGGGAAIEAAAAESLAQQTSADDLLRIGHDLLEAGRWAWAREVFYVATQLAPNRPGAFSGLSDARRAIADAEAREGKPASEAPAFAAADLSRAHDLDPADVMLKAEMAFRSGAAPAGAPGHEEARDEQYLVKPAFFLQKARENPVKKGEIVDRQLHWLRVVTYHDDKRVSQLMHYSREIVIEPRTDNDQYESLPAEGDELELLLARVYKKDGTVQAPDEQSSGGRKPYVRWPELHTGDVVEVAVRAWTSGPVGLRGQAPFWFIDYVGSTDTHPILWNQVVVDSPEATPLAIDVLHGKADRTTSTKNGGRVVTSYTWDAPPSVPDEPLAPKLSEVLPVVVGSTFGSWAAFRAWYEEAVKGFSEPDAQVKQKAAELTAGKKTREEKVRAIFEFVADDIRYVNYISGEWWLPNRPQELLARRQGDCDDKAMLLITLLKAIGIDANEALVQTRYTAQPSLLLSERAAIPLFDHGIAYLPGENGKPGTWLDATSPESRLGPLPSMDARTVAFFIDGGPPRVVETPASSPEDHGVDATWTITLSPTGAGELVADERHMGDAAFELRMNLKQPDARAQWVEQYLASGWFPTVQVTGDISFEPDLGRGAATLKYGAHTDGFARREGRELAVPLAESSTLTSQLAPLVKRVLPVVLPARLAPGHETRTITIVAPPGYTFADLPPNGEVKGGEFGRAKLEFKRALGKNAVVAKRSVVFDLSTIPVEKYAKWRGWLQQVDGLMHRTVRLVPDDRTAGPKGGGAAVAKKAGAGAPKGKR